MQRIKLKLDLTQSIYEEFPECSPLFYEMTEQIAETMYDAYYFTPDFENDTLKDFKEEVANVFSGLYGEFMPEMSFVVEGEDNIKSGLLLCIYKEEPTITYLFTRPRQQRKGYSSNLLSTCCAKLKQIGFTSLYVYLNLENTPAYNLFEKFGFNEISIE